MWSETSGFFRNEIFLPSVVISDNTINILNGKRRVNVFTTQKMDALEHCWIFFFFFMGIYMIQVSRGINLMHLNLLNLILNCIFFIFWYVLYSIKMEMALSTCYRFISGLFPYCLYWLLTLATKWLNKVIFVWVCETMFWDL